MDHKIEKKRVVSPPLSLNKHVAQHDTWLHFKKDVENQTIEEIFASVHVTPDNQECVLQTEVPDSQKMLVSEEIIVRKTSAFYQQ
jgi:hypothetical protein